MSVQPILPIAGVSDELIRVLNDRFRQVPAAVTPEATISAGKPVPTQNRAIVQTVTAGVLHGTHAIRTSYPGTDGTLYVETDRNGLVYLYDGAGWKYVAGTYQRAQSQLAALVATLGANDAGLLVEVTDFAHTLRWSGSAWQWGSGEQGGGMLVSFAVSPGTGWAACNGGTVPYLKSDGTTGSVTLPNTSATAAYVQNGPGYSPTIAAAVLPTFAGTVGQTTSGPSATAAVQSGAGSTPASSAHTHTLTPAGTVALPADPIANFPAPLYFRQ